MMEWEGCRAWLYWHCNCFGSVTLVFSATSTCASLKRLPCELVSFAAPMRIPAWGCQSWAMPMQAKPHSLPSSRVLDKFREATVVLQIDIPQVYFGSVLLFSVIWLSPPPPPLPLPPEANVADLTIGINCGTWGCRKNGHDKVITFHHWDFKGQVRHYISI